MSAIGGPATINSGLVLELDAGNIKSYPTTGTTWFDKSGNANNGTLTNSPTFNTGSLGSIVFDGTDDYITLPNGLLSGTGDFTINQFIKANANETGGTTFGNFPAGNLQVFFGSNFIGLWLNNNSTYLGTSPWNTVLPEFTTQPVMITAIRSGTTTFFYINSDLKKTGSSSSTIGISSNPFRIGDNTNSSASEKFAGNIYYTQVYNRALSASEVQQNFNATRARFGI